MSRKQMNLTNGKENTMYQKQYIYIDGKKTEIEDVQASIFWDNLKELKNGNIAQCMNWEQVEEMLECFDNNENFEIGEYEKVFYILPENTTSHNRNLYNKALQGIEYIKD